MIEVLATQFQTIPQAPEHISIANLKCWITVIIAFMKRKINGKDSGYFKNTDLNNDFEEQNSLESELSLMDDIEHYHSLQMLTSKHIESA